MLRESSANFRIYNSSSFLSKTISAIDYKLIEKEIINSEKSKPLNYILNINDTESTYKKYLKEVFFPQVDSQQMLSEDASLFSEVFKVMNKINTRISEIETKMDSLKTIDLTMKQIKVLEKAKQDYHDAKTEYEFLKNKVVHFPMEIKQHDFHRKINDIYLDLSLINMRLTEIN